MSQEQEKVDKFGRVFLLSLAILISVAFLYMIRAQITPLLMGAILAGLSMPLYDKLRRRTRNRSTLAATLTVLILILVVILPLNFLIGLVASQAVEVGGAIGPWLQEHTSDTEQLDAWIRRLPFEDKIEPYRAQITAKLAELASTVGQFIVSSLATATKGTASFFLGLFIMLYASFFYLTHGRGTLNRILYYVPLKSGEEDRLVSRFLSVARATVKGTLVIAIVQGALGAVALAIVGVPGWAFWGALIAVLSLIPAIGAGIIWVPVAIYLVIAGRVGSAVFIVAWFMVVVGLSDNILRPILVGKDTEMSDLMVLISTFGGLATFGVTGLLLGPIVAALLDTVWAMYGEAFKHVLPPRPSVAEE